MKIEELHQIIEWLTGYNEKKLQELISKGYNAKILGTNKWNLTQVAFESLHDEVEALNKLKSIHKTESKDAWLLVQEF